MEWTCGRLVGRAPGSGRIGENVGTIGPRDGRGDLLDHGHGIGRKFRGHHGSSLHLI
jgi:hypothetical protein